MWITFHRFSAIFEAFVPHFYLRCTRCTVPESRLNHLKSFHRRMFKPKAKFDADSFALLSHFECDSHTVLMLTQWCVPPPLTSTVKPSLFTHAYSSSLFLAARLHQYRTSCSHYISNGWTFSGQPLYKFSYSLEKRAL